jgi:Uma2 family endonuclease
MTLDEYLVWEEKSSIKHEYVGGEVYAMSGVTVRHNLITLNIARALHGVARKRGCRMLATDVKLRAAADRIYYPDNMLVCGKAASVDLVVDAPSMIVEVTSPSTRGTDRREKLDAYMRLPSLQGYLIVDQRRRHVLAYTRGRGAEWTREEAAGTGEVRLAFLGATLSLDDIYEDVPLPPLAVGEGDDDSWYDVSGDEDAD